LAAILAHYRRIGGEHPVEEKPVCAADTKPVHNTARRTSGLLKELARIYRDLKGAVKANTTYSVFYRSWAGRRYPLCSQTLRILRFESRV